jgi:dTDP-4-amino-4,6-dideoxygalactose transaminase
MAEKLALLGGSPTVTLPHPAYPVMGREEVTGVVDTLMKGQLSQVGHGGVVGEMEDAYAAYFGTRYCHSFNSGTAAIHSALFALGVGPGDEVLTASNTWISGINAICHSGAAPVFCDTAKNRHHIAPAEIRRRAGKHTKAIVVTHLWGFPADMDPIMKAARDCGLAVVEDCSHAHGGKYKGRYLGTIGDIGAFSLQGSKAIVAGEGGFLLTNRKLWYERAMIPGDHGVRLGQEISCQSLNGFTRGGGAWTYRIAPICAAVALAQLGRLDSLNAARQANFDQLAKRLRKDAPFIRLPSLHRGSVRGWYGTPAIYDFDQEAVSRDLFCQACAAEGAGVRGTGYDNYYTVPLFQDTALYGQLWHVQHANGVTYTPTPPGSLENHEDLRRRSLLLTIPAEPAPALMTQVADAIAKVAANMAALAAQ